MKISIFAVALVATFALPVYAQEVQPEHALSFNAALTTDYRYRGISQTRLEPALQGGADFTHNPSGLYAGTWLSSIQWTRDAGGSGNVEWDVYAGKRGQLGADLSYDTGVLGYIYPANGLKAVAGFADANTAEVYGQLGYKDFYAKYSWSLTNLFGFVDSHHSGYLDIGANVGLADGLALNIHAGRQQVRHNGPASYTDWKLGLSKDWGIVTGALALVGTNAGQAAYASPANGKFLGRQALVASVSKTF
ncbi:TorF family putative porin [Massilia agilis]|uniref:TorF family putative porin n=1 Tax=Massilia agilis TaxID=1811226 RepID=A0ABT2D642_9BURK|nr:TorF family putative porin [Massilia agilis]MCS0806785.1 TorF family putative porin [Massilia agilis]